MNRAEAKFILRAYRADGQDASDPQFREALELVKHDPELAQWFAEEQALDLRIANKVRAFPVPPDLKSQLLAARKVVQLPVWWRRPAWRAAAAGLVLLIGISAFLFVQATRTNFPKEQTSFAQYRDTMADFAGNKLWRLDLKTRDVKEIRQWLTQKNAHGDLLLPAGLDGRPGVGCRVLNWSGKTVSLVCFELQNHQIAHLLVIDQDAFQDAPATPVFDQTGALATMSWSQGGKAYMLVSKGSSQADLMKLL
jgi:hypothetical protein